MDRLVSRDVTFIEREIAKTPHLFRTRSYLPKVVTNDPSLNPITPIYLRLNNTADNVGPIAHLFRNPTHSNELNRITHQKNSQPRLYY